MPAWGRLVKSLERGHNVAGPEKGRDQHGGSRYDPGHGPVNLLLVLLAVHAGPAADTVPPYLAFPEAGLDDPSAYRGYQTRVYRDSRRNALQIYLDRRTGRVVHLWADAADESIGFTARDSAGRPAAVSWGAERAVATGSGLVRSLTYRLEAPSPTRLGLFLLGSMRVERDFGYAARDSLPLGAPAFPEAELLALIGRLERLPPGERARHLALLGARSVDQLRRRLEPTLTLGRRGTTWSVRVEQSSFDGKNHLALVLAGDSRMTEAALAGGVVGLRSRAGQPVRLTVTVRTDAAALTPLSRNEIFNDDFRRFYAAVAADTAHPARRRRLEREVRGSELLCYREKLMAGLPNYATYFGRDMLMTALLMEPVWAPDMPEHVIASALRKLRSDGNVSHEEALGGQAVREHAAEYNALVDQGALDSARAVLAHLTAVRENYQMVDDDFQLPVVVARYLADARVPPARKRRFLLAEGRLARLVANLAFVARRAEPFAREPVATNLVSFAKAPDGHWISASWRDSRDGYGGGRFAMDVNAIWVPHALEGIGTILDALAGIGFPRAALDSLAPAIRQEPLAAWAQDRAALERAVAVWKGAERHFQVALPAREVNERIAARLNWLPAPEREFWERRVQQLGEPADTLRFLALSLDGEGRPIPIVNTDPAMLLLLGPLAPERVLDLVGPILLDYPRGLLVEEAGPLVANDAYAPREVWESFRGDPYHSPTVVWGRDVNLLLAGLAKQSRNPGGARLEEAARRVAAAVARSGIRDAELWSYRIEGGRLIASRYGTSSDVQLWSLTDLAVQYLENRPPA